MAAVAMEDGVVSIPFTQALAGDAIVELRASRTLAKDADRVTWRLPTPRADLVGPAVVVVTSRSDIELLPDADALSGLVRQTAAAVPLVDADRTALVYRLDGSEGVFAAARRFLPRRIEANLAMQATIGGSEVAVDQSLRLTVLHVPLEVVELAVPRAVSDVGFEVRLGGRLLDPTPAATGTASIDEAYRVILPEPLLGAGELMVSYRLPAPDVPPESTVPLDLPQVVPLSGGIGRQSVTVVADEPLAVGVRNDEWRRDVGPAGGATAQTWTAIRPQADVPLALSTRRSDAARSMVVEAAWLRTRLLPGQREDVATYVVSGATGPIACTLPGDAADSERTIREVLLGGTVVPSAVRPGGRVVVDPPEVDPRRRWRIDIRSVTPRDEGWAGVAARLGMPEPMLLASPTFDPPVVERRFYWTILARGDERVVGIPAAWNSEQRWEAAGFGWRQQSVVSDADLAAWIEAVAGGDAHGEPAVNADPPLAGRHFAWSGLGRPESAVAWLIPDWLILLVSSGAALALGLAVVYRPWFRRVSVLVIAAAAAGFLAALAPAAAPLVAQAALPGCLLAVAAGALRRVLEPARAVSAVAGPPPASSLTRVREGASLIVESAVATGSTATQRRSP